jgi:hypothetical protein
VYDYVDALALLVLGLVALERQEPTFAGKRERFEIITFCLSAGREIQEPELVVYLLVACLRSIPIVFRRPDRIGRLPNGTMTTESDVVL